MSKDANIPFQVENIINSMLNPSENIHIRGNYRSRLDIIRTEINKAITKYDHELLMANHRKKKA
jgi:hypothetical protein